MATAELLPIGEVARRAGLRPSALRYYEEEGLVEPATRIGGRRRYGPTVLHRLAVIRLLRDAGFTIREIRRLVAEGSAPAGWRDLARRKLRETEARIAEAEETRRLLLRALDCDCRSLEGCEAIGQGPGGHRRSPGREPSRMPPG